MIKAIIFDMDGLMIDSERITYEGYQHILNQQNLEIPLEFYKSLLGKTIENATIQFHEFYGKEFDVLNTIKNTHQYIDNRFEQEGVPLKKGLIELLTYLKANNYKTIVATSSQRQRVNRILSIANITQYFDASICGDEVNNGKPDPEVFLKACEKLDVCPSEAIVLEDSEAGINAAYNANIKVICIPDMKYPDSKYQKMATMMMDSLLDVLAYLKNQHN